LPTIAANGSSQVTLQVEAIDTGGNVTTIAPISIQLLRDTTPPKLLHENIFEGEVISPNSRAFIFDFSKSLDEKTVSASTFVLIGPGGESLSPQSIQFRNIDKEVQLTYPTLALGDYQFKIAAPSITDTSGNALGSSQLTTNFSVEQFTAFWNNAAGGSWAVGSNWLSGQVPVSADSVGISDGATVTFESGVATVARLTIEGGSSLAVTGGALSITGQLDITSGTLKLNTGGTIKSAIISNSGGSIDYGGGTVDDVTIEGTLNLSAANATVTVAHGIVLTGANGAGSGSIDLTGANSSLVFSGNQTLENSTIDIGGNSGTIATNGAPTSPSLLLSSDSGSGNTVLTIGTNSIVKHAGNFAVIANSGMAGDEVVNRGTIIANLEGGHLGIVPSDFINEGTIAISNGDGVDFGLTGTTWTNHGTVTITGLDSQLLLRGSFSTSDLGSIANAGQVFIGGTLNNTGATLNLGAGTNYSTFVLFGGDLPGTTDFVPGEIKGGVITDSGSGLQLAGGTLDDVTYESELDLSKPNAGVVIADGLTLTGPGGSGNGVVNLTGANSVVAFDGTQSFDNATLNIGSDSGSIAPNGAFTAGSILVNDAAGSGKSVLTLGSGLTIKQVGLYAAIVGPNLSGDEVVNKATINADVSGGLFGVAPNDFINQGTIAVDNGDRVSIGFTGFGGGEWTNQGTITVQGSGSELSLEGNFKTNDLGTIDNAARVFVDGSLDNTGATLNLGAGSSYGSFVLFSGSPAGVPINLPGEIKGGTIVDRGSGLLLEGGTLDGVRYQGALDLSVSKASLTVKDGLDATDTAGSGPGTVNLTGVNSTLYFLGTQTFGNATINIGNNTSYSSLFNYDPSGGNAVLTLGAGLTIQQKGTYAQIDGGGSIGSTAPPVVPPSPAAFSTIKVFVSEDAFLGDAKFTVTADGHQIGTTYAITTLHSSGQFQEIDITADLGATGPKSVAVNYINDAYGGSPSADRNLYVQKMVVNGATFAATSAANAADSAGLVDPNDAPMINDGSLTFTTTGAAPSSTGVVNHGAIVNDGTINATATNGYLYIEPDSFTNNGTVNVANGENIVIGNAVGGSGKISIADTSRVELSGASAANVAFTAGSTGRLTIDDSQAYTGTVAGFAPGNHIDLADISFGAHTTLGYTPNDSNSGGVLTASDGAHVAKIALLGQYAAASFAMASDGHGGTLITDPPELIAQTQLTRPHG
jgi:hypothetical protein